MKKLLLGFVLMGILAGTTLAQSEAIKDLADGFEQKNRGDWVLVHFPDRCMVDVTVFQTCISLALVKSLGCPEFDKCKPLVEFVNSGLFVQTKTQGLLKINPLDVSDENKTIVGISFEVPKKVNL